MRVEEASVRRKGETLQSRFYDPRDALILEYSRDQECFESKHEYGSRSYYIPNVYLSAFHHRPFNLYCYLFYVKYLCNLTIVNDVKLMEFELERDLDKEKIALKIY